MSKEYEEKRGPRGADEHTEKRFPRERRAEERVPMRERDAEADGLIEGRNAVTEALRAGTPIDKIFIARGETDKTLGHIASTARAAGVVVVEADRRKLDYMSATKAHQGVIALAAVREYASVEDILSAARERGEAPLLVVCDEISDPHNLGAIIRTAECVGAHGVIIPKRRSAGLTAVVDKTSAGRARAHGRRACAESRRRDRDAQEKRSLDLRHCRRGRKRAVENGSDRPGLHRHRVGGHRHQPAGAGKV